MVLIRPKAGAIKAVAPKAADNGFVNVREFAETVAAALADVARFFARSACAIVSAVAEAEAPRDFVTLTRAVATAVVSAFAAKFFVRLALEATTAVPAAVEAKFFASVTSAFAEEADAAADAPRFLTIKADADVETAACICPKRTARGTSRLARALIEAAPSAEA